MDYPKLSIRNWKKQLAWLKTKVHTISTHQPVFLENDNFKLYWNRSILTDKTILFNRPDITFMNKKTNNTFLIDIAVPNTHSFIHFVRQTTKWMNVYLRQLCLSESCSLFSYSWRLCQVHIKQYCFVRKYAAVPVRLEIVVLQYIGWCVLMVWTFVHNQVSCFC